MRRLAGVLVVVVLAGCGGGSPPDEMDRARELAGSDVVMVEPGVYRRTTDGLLVGPCDKVKPYVEEHGKPDGFLCY